jgi:hypothetical protein
MSFIFKYLNNFEMKLLLPNSEYVNGSRRRAIGIIIPNEWNKLRDHLLKNNRGFSELIQLLT